MLGTLLGIWDKLEKTEDKDLQGSLHSMGVGGDIKIKISIMSSMLDKYYGIKQVIVKEIRISRRMMDQIAAENKVEYASLSWELMRENMNKSIG